MLKYLKTAPPAARIEFAAVGVWILAGLAAAIAAGVQWTLNPPVPLVTPDGVVHANPPVIQPILTMIGIGAVASLPNVGVGALLHSRDRSAVWAGAIMAILLAVLYVGVVSWVTIDSLIYAASQPGGGGGLDSEFLVVGSLLVGTGALHAVSGVVALRSLTRSNRVSGPRPAGA